MDPTDKFRKQSDESPPPSSWLPSISYTIAYFILPPFAFTDCDKLVTTWTDPSKFAGQLLYLLGCKARKVEPVKDDANRFRLYHGQLDAARDYYLLEYPAPPPIDFSLNDPAQLAPDGRPVLAPYFSAVLRHRQTKAVSYYTLGQAPYSGTTLRSVSPTADGWSNANHGPGPDPRLEEFLACLRTKV